jgi:hypothetical protein
MSRYPGEEMAAIAPTRSAITFVLVGLSLIEQDRVSVRCHSGGTG